MTHEYDTKTTVEIAVSFDGRFIINKRLTSGSKIYFDIKMALKGEKLERYYDFLDHKKQVFMNHVVRVGAKILDFNDKDFDLDTILQLFIPSKEVMKFIIEKKLEQIKAKRNKDPVDGNYLDSCLMNCFRNEFKKREDELLEMTRQSNAFGGHSTSLESSFIQFKTPKESPEAMHQEEHEKPDNNIKIPDACESRFVTQVINPGEMSKIFVQKSRVDVANTAMEKPDFADHIETIYIYREPKK